MEEYQERGVRHPAREIIQQGTGGFPITQIEHRVRPRPDWFAPLGPTSDPALAVCYRRHVIIGGIKLGLAHAALCFSPAIVSHVRSKELMEDASFRVRRKERFIVCKNACARQQ
jgi:hypothetical protein